MVITIALACCIHLLAPTFADTCFDVAAMLRLEGAPAATYRPVSVLVLSKTGFQREE